MKIWRMDLLYVVAGIYELDAYLNEPMCTVVPGDRRASPVDASEILGDQCRWGIVICLPGTSEL